MTERSAQSAVTLLFVILLGALFVYVVEDIPAFGDPNSPPNKYVNLSIGVDAKGAGVLDNLDGGILPNDLHDKILKRGFPLPDDYEITKEGDGWDVLIPKGEIFYPGPEKYYFIKKEADTLWVYRYSIPVRWMEKCEEEVGVPNMVTAGLADYRGYDTLGETVVIFTAGMTVILLLRRRGRL